MSTIDVNGRSVPVSFAAELPATLEEVLSCSQFLDWVASLDPGFLLRSIRIQSVDMFGPRIGFLKLVAEAEIDGRPVPGVCFLRGGAVVLLPILECRGTLYTLLTLQPRLPSGQLTLAELPAGMVDGGSFGGAAAKEIEEETGLRFLESELVDITGDGGPVFFSPGGSDEQARFFMARRRLAAYELADLEGRMTGELHEGERITLRVIPLDQLPVATRDGKSLIAWALYQRYLSRARD